MHSNSSEQRNAVPARLSIYMRLGISAILLTGLLACTLFSNPISLIPNPANIVTQEAGKLEATLLASGQDQSQGSQPTPNQTAVVVTPVTKLPISFTYASLKFTLTKAVITNQRPANSSNQVSNGSYAVTTWKIINQTHQSIYVNGGFYLKLMDGTTASQSFDNVVNQLDTLETKVVFGLPQGATWQNSQISFSEEDKEPAILGIDGPSPQVKYPIMLAPIDKVELTSPQIIYQVKSASVDLDGMGKRAGTGKEWVVFSIDANCKQDNSCFVGGDLFRLIVDDTPYAPSSLDPVDLAVNSDTTQNIKIAFEIPQNPNKVLFQFGEASQDNKQIPLDLTKTK